MTAKDYVEKYLRTLQEAPGSRVFTEVAAEMMQEFIAEVIEYRDSARRSPGAVTAKLREVNQKWNATLAKFPAEVSNLLQRNAVLNVCNTQMGTKIQPRKQNHYNTMQELRRASKKGSAS